MYDSPTTKGRTEHYLPIYLETLRVDSVLEFDLYLNQGLDFVLYRAAKLPFAEQNRKQLLDNRIAMLHDIGKTKINDSILGKEGPLTNDEMEIVRCHPQWGCDLAKKTDLIDQESYFPIIQHHERENQTGYPHSTGTKNIHLYGKITAIADVFDAMTTRRVYRDAVEAFPALKEMYADHGAFDQELLASFTQMLGPTHLNSRKISEDN